MPDSSQDDRDYYAFLLDDKSDNSKATETKTMITDSNFEESQMELRGDPKRQTANKVQTANFETALV